MARGAFIGRSSELNLIDRLWDSPNAEFMILYGRRRIGKTRLLTHWINQHGTEGMYWMAEPTSAVDQLRSFSQAIANFMEPDDPAPLDFSYANWEQAFRQIAMLARGRRTAVFIDEITYLMDTNASIIGTLQKVWDHRLKQSDVLLALSGSQMGAMKKQLLSYQAPLYGRSTAQVSLSPLPYGASKDYFPNYTPEERVRLYAILGGVPAYWERIDLDITVMENLRQLIEPSNAWMLDEPRLLLQDFITDLYNYVGIMRAMAQGAHTLSEIGERNGLSSTHMTSYLQVLRETGFVERRVPITQRNIKSRLGRYHVTDPFLRFYYRFLAAYQSRLALGQQRQVVDAIEKDMDSFIEVNTWQELCQQWVALADDQGELPISIEAVGGEWRRNYGIDVVGISEAEKTLILGSCQWGDQPGRIDDLERAIQNATSVIPRNEEWTVYYLGFAAQGWSPGDRLRAEAALTNKAKRGRTHWKFAGMRLLDLEEVDRDLTRWQV
ncbi:MAG: ATP-binding protein [Chloroflexota bacterium]